MRYDEVYYNEEFNGSIETLADQIHVMKILELERLVEHNKNELLKSSKAGFPNWWRTEKDTLLNVLNKKLNILYAHKLRNRK